MGKFEAYISQFNLDARVSDEDIKKVKLLLQLYSPTLRVTSHRINDMETGCGIKRSQSVTDYINLAIDFDHDADCKRIAERLSEMGHSMQLLSLMEDALMLLKSDNNHGWKYFEILRVRYFDDSCPSHEDAYLALGLSPATYYRNLKKAIRRYAAYLLYVVIPDMILACSDCNDTLSALDSRAHDDVGIK